MERENSPPWRGAEGGVVTTADYHQIQLFYYHLCSKEFLYIMLLSLRLWVVHLLGGEPEGRVGYPSRYSCYYPQVKSTYNTQ